jgi:flagellar basal-body rod modification protein FlgD
LGSTEISLHLDGAQSGVLRVYDARGRLVSTVAEGPLTSGDHKFEWDGRDIRGQKVPSGVYFIRFEGENKSLSKKVVLLRR